MHALTPENDADLIVYVDIKSPYAYLAIAPTIELFDELRVKADWRPLTLDIPSYLGSAKTNKSGKVTKQNRSASQWGAVRYAYNDAKRYARLRDITLYGTQKIWDSSLASIGLLWARAQGQHAAQRYLQTVYPPFWKRDLDIEQVSIVRETLSQADVDVTGFDEYATSAGREAHDTLQAQLHPAGIFGVPTYVVGEELFFGREHLPAIRWLLTGQQGPAPEIGYNPDSLA